MNPRTTEPLHQDHLFNDISLSCVDGRCTDPIVGTAGGSIGELIAVLAAVEAHTGQALGADAVTEILSRVAAEVAPIYHHSDHMCFQRLFGGEAPTELSPQSFHDALDKLDDPNVYGCGHVAGMLRAPEAYCVRPGLVRDTIAGFYSLLRGGHPAMHFEVLEGSHAEDEVHIIEDCGPRFSPHRPREGSSQRFVAHPHAATLIRDAYAQDIAQGFGLPIAELRSAADVLAERMASRTLDTLARDLPRVHIPH